MDACIPAPLFAAAYLFTSTETTRYYLQGVFLERLAEGAGLTLAATNGHVLGAGLTAQGFTRKDVILQVTDRPFLSACRSDDRAWICIPDGELDKAAPELFLVVTDSLNPPDDAMLKQARRQPPNKRAVIGEMKARAQGAIVDGTFPSWRRVVPTTGKPRKDAVLGTWFFNADYIALLRDAAFALTHSKAAMFRFTACDDDTEEAPGPMLVQFGPPSDNGDQFIGVIMPMRGFGGPASGRTKPDWLAIPSAADAASMLQHELEREPEKEGAPA